MESNAMLSRIQLELARTPRFPEGSANHGYEFVAPLTGEGHVDLHAWHENKESCIATRFWGDAPEEQGRFVHTRGGWCFDYGAVDMQDEEPFYKLDRHTFIPGNYVTITERDGKQYPFKIMSVVPVIR